MIADALIGPSESPCLPLWFVRESDLGAFKASHPELSAWIEQNGFLAERQRVLVIPGPRGEVEGAVVGLGALSDWGQLAWWHTARLVIFASRVDCLP
jgi:hypothetical protein